MRIRRFYNLFIIFIVLTWILTSVLVPAKLHIYAQNTSFSENQGSYGSETSPDDNTETDTENMDGENPTSDDNNNDNPEDEFKDENDGSVETDTDTGDENTSKDPDLPYLEEEMPPEEILFAPMMDMLDSVGINSKEKLEEAIDNAPSGEPTEIIITGSFDISETIKIDANKIITIRSNTGGPYTINQTSTHGQKSRHFNVLGQLTLQDIIIYAGNTISSSTVGSGGIDVGNPKSGQYAVLTLDSGAVIDSCHVNKTAYGGGVAVLQGGKLIMNSGSSIKNCNNKGGTYGGGAVYIAQAAKSTESDNGIFIMNGGSIINNKTGGRGGGVYIGGPATASIRPDWSYGEFYFYDGLIDNNQGSPGGGTSDQVGSGVYVGGTFYMYGGTISNNYMSGQYALYGGGVMVSPWGLFEMYDGTIENNTANFGGGGVGIYAGQFTMHGGTIRNNTATSAMGGGILILGDNNPEYQNGTFTLYDGTIEGNQAQRGGGIEINIGILNMYGGTINNNYADIRGGGGIAAAIATLNISGGSVINNTTEGNGGGIILVRSDRNDLYADINDLIIIGNTAKGDGGGMYVEDPNYANFDTNSNTIFWNNKAQAAFDPPNGAYDTYPNIRFGAVSAIFDHPLNNYDINFAGYPPLNPPDEVLDLTVKVIDKKDNKEWVNAQLNLYLDFNDTPIYYSLLNNSDIYWSTNKENAEVFVTDNKGEFVIKDLPVGMEYTFYQHVDYRGYNPFGGSILFDKDNDFLLIEAEPISETTPPDPSEGSDHQTDPEKDKDNINSFISVIYHLNDGTFPDIYLVKNINPGATVSPPEPPVREGYIFDGWYLEKDCVTPFNFSTRIYENLHLYAKWILDLPFTDEHYAYIVGYEDSTVRPLSNITRAETATIFYRLLNDDFRQGVLTQYNPFSDILLEMWHNIAVSSMNKAMVISGYPDGTFRPSENITRAEFASIATRFTNALPNSIDTPFTDIHGHWAESYINLAYNLGWISGYPDNTFRPDTYITRAEVASLVNRILVRQPLSADHLHKDMLVWPDNAERTAWYYLDIQEATNSHTYELYNKDTAYEYWIELIENFDWLSIEAPGSIRPN